MTDEQQSKPSVWGDLFYLILPVVLFPGAVYLGVKLRVVEPITGADWLVLLAAIIAVAVTNMFGFYASIRAEVHRLGYELCALSLGACLSLLAAQLVSETDLLPGVSGSRIGDVFTVVPGEIVAQRVALISLIGFVSVVALGVTARIVRAVDHEKPRKPAWLKLISYIAGFAMLFTYVALLVGGQ